MEKRTKKSIKAEISKRLLDLSKSERWKGKVKSQKDWSKFCKKAAEDCRKIVELLKEENGNTIKEV